MPLRLAASPGMQLDLRGQNSEDALDMLESYLDKAYLAGMPFVRIIHGKGIGQLRQTVHTILEKHPDVASFNLASEHFGGWGATIVHLQPPSPDP